MKAQTFIEKLQNKTKEQIIAYLTLRYKKIIAPNKK